MSGFEISGTADVRVSEWRDIETAPKNGEEIMVFDCDDPPHGIIWLACWQDGEWTAEDWMNLRFVTHWMPLPEPPK